MSTAAPETRTLAAPEVRTEGRRLVGYAAVYESPSRDLGGFRERIAPGAFDAVLAAGPDVTLALNHSDDAVLARTSAGTLRLRSDERGLRFEADLPDSPLGQNAREAVRRGDISGASFRFVVAPDGERWEDDVRVVTRVAELLDVSLATRPAYEAARVELRTYNTKAKEDTMASTTEAQAPAEATTAAPAPEPVTVEERTEPPAEERAAPGSLRVEDRTAAAGEPVEDRVRDALREVRRGEARALTTASTLAPGELSSFLFDKLRARSVALASGIRVIATDKDTVTFPRLTADVAPGWVAEAATIPAGDPTLDSITATPRKLAHRVEFSNEVIEDSEPSALDVVRDNLVAAMALKLDLGIYEGSGTAPEIRGLKNVSGIGSVSMGTNGAALTNLDPFADAMRLLETANARPGAIVMHPRTWGAVRKLKDSQGRYLVGSGSGDAPATIFGVPVFVTSQLSIAETQGTSTNASSAYVYAPGEVYLVRRRDIEVELDRSRLFDSDQSELRGRMRADLIVPNPTAVCRIAGITP